MTRLYDQNVDVRDGNTGVIGRDNSYAKISFAILLDSLISLVLPVTTAGDYY